MRIERDDGRHRVPGSLAVEVQHHVDDGLMAPVQSVEDADGDHRITRGQLRGLPIAHDNHELKLPVRRIVARCQDQLGLPRILSALQDTDEVARGIHRRDLIAGEGPIERDPLTHAHRTSLVVAQRRVFETGDE